ncbi:MAG TPA: hypothetical protein VM490_08615 [Armatimonadaceae bacterium]|jgi:hypothetical protein|nr:hypothetical protein [Armatimonadaceae bacterium]
MSSALPEWKGNGAMSGPNPVASISPAARRRKRAGFATMTTLFMVVLAVVAVFVIISSSLAQIQLSRRGQNRSTALVLAEAGVDDTLDRLRLNPKYVGGSGTLFEDPPTNTATFGTYATTVTELTEETRKVQSVGTNPDGSTGEVAAIVRIDMRALGSAAIASNHAVNINGTANILTTPLDAHVANVHSNNNVVMGSNSIVDGYLSAVGTTSGTAYFPSKPGSPEMYFPDSATTTDWRQKWALQAMAGGVINSNVNKSATITGPKYINGDITLNNYESVKLTGSGIIYVRGNVRLTGQAILENGVTLIVEGTFEQQGGTVYKVTTGITPTPTLAVYGSNKSDTDDVVSLAGGSLNVHQGIVYAVKGRIKVAGGSTFVGALVAGGKAGGVAATGNYTHLYPKDMASIIKFPTDPRVESIIEF